MLRGAVLPLESAKQQQVQKKRHETLNKETQEGQKQVGEIEALCYLMCFCYDERSEC